MKSPYVSELQPNQVITTTLLVQWKEVRQKKTGEPYLCLTLSDRTGDLDAKMWENVHEVVDSFQKDDFLRVKGLTQVYQNKLQLTVHKLSKLDQREVDFTDFFPASPRDPAVMYAELQEIVAGIGNPHLHQLLQALLADPEIARLFKLAPAAKVIHHAYLGGLLEHVLSLCALCRLVGPHYPQVDLDLLLTGAVLHDIGKIYELSYDRAFGYSTEGQLLGHIVIALRIIGDKLALVPDFPPKLRLLLEHMIISHHGELEFGSPKVPLFAEALLLHHLDNLDSKMEAMRSFAERDKQIEGMFTSYCAFLERAVFKKQKYVEEPATTAVPASAPAAASTAKPLPANPAPPPQSGKLNSTFAEKLNLALRKDS